VTRDDWLGGFSALPEWWARHDARNISITKLLALDLIHEAEDFVQLLPAKSDTLLGGQLLLFLAQEIYPQRHQVMAFVVAALDYQLFSV